jgi:hypothetical protein
MQLLLYTIGFFLANIFSVVFAYDKFDIRKHMASNTVYQFTHDQSEQSYPQNCELEKLFLVARHGTRFPERSDIEHFNTLEKIFQNSKHNDKVISCFLKNLFNNNNNNNNNLKYM